MQILLIVVLLVTAVITVAVKDWVDAGIILAVVLVNAILGFIQRYQAEWTIEATAQVMTTEWVFPTSPWQTGCFPAPPLALNRGRASCCMAC